MQISRGAIGKPIDVVFGGETSYQEGHWKHFPEAEYRILDPQRTTWNISATEIRNQPYRHWDYIVGAARPFFTKRVLVTGPESCGKTTLTKKLAKVFYTSWSEEVGGTYQEEVLGGDGTLFEPEDFNRIAQLQHEQDLKALESASKVCFFDTDAVVTVFYSDFFLGVISGQLESFIDPAKYDLILALAPTVPWVDDGMRDSSDVGIRKAGFDKLMGMYRKYGFDRERILVIDSPDYYDRMEACIKAVEKIL